MRQTYSGFCKLEGKTRPLPRRQDTRSTMWVEVRVERDSRADGKSRIASVLPGLIQELVLLGQMALHQGDVVAACSLLEASATLTRQIQQEQNRIEPTSLPAWVLALQGNGLETGVPAEECLLPGRKGDDGEAAVSGLPEVGGVVAQRQALMPESSPRTLKQVPTLRVPVGSSGELSAREVEVLRLVAQGLTDAQVAQQLVISRRTVNWHLTTIYSKLGVSSRSAATRYALEQQVI